MARTSNRELARQIGVSESAVRRAEKAGRIKREANGAWDPAKVKAAWSDNTDQAQQRPAAGGKPRSPKRARATLKPVPEAAVGAVRDTLREHGEPVSAAGMTFMQARTANEVLKAQERRLRLQQMKGELIDRAKAVAQVFRLAREERDAWVNWPARVAAVVAAELSASCSDAAGGAVQVDQHSLHTVLERHVREHLAEMAEIRPSLR
jgi:DNA-binding Lrp family transcriptional regulator